MSIWRAWWLMVTQCIRGRHTWKFRSDIDAECQACGAVLFTDLD